MKKWMLLFALLFSGWTWAQEEGFHYTFRPGDSLWKLCERFAQDANLCWQDLATRNNISNARAISPGTRLVIPLEWLREQPVEARVSNLSGVAYRIARNSNERIALASQDTLSMGDTVETEEGALVVEFADKSRLVIRPHSRVVFDRYSRFNNHGMVDTNLRLERGSVRTRVAPRQGAEDPFIITTPTAAAAVRGTEFDVSFDENGVMRTEVDGGLVAVSAQSQEQAVGAGYATLARSGEPPLEPVQQLPAVSAAVVQSAEGGIVLEWLALEGASGYQLELYRGEELLLVAQAASSRWASAELPEGDYQIVLRAVDSNGLKGNRLEVAATVVPKPEVIELPEQQDSGMREVLLFLLGGLLILVTI